MAFGALRVQGFSRGKLNPTDRSSGLVGSLGQTMEVSRGTQVPPAQPAWKTRGHPLSSGLGEVHGAPGCWAVRCGAFSLYLEAFLWWSLVSLTIMWQNPCHGLILKPFQRTHRWRSQIRPVVPCGDFAASLRVLMAVQGHEFWKRAPYPWLWMPCMAFLQDFHVCTCRPLAHGIQEMSATPSVS